MNKTANDEQELEPKSLKENPKDMAAGAKVDRYARMRIPGLDVAKLTQSRILVIGAGGVGAPLLMYLAGAGVKHITVCDGDTVSLSNLHRQIIYQEAQIGQAKVTLAAQALTKLNSEVEVKTRGLLETNEQVLEAMGLGGTVALEPNVASKQVPSTQKVDLASTELKPQTAVVDLVIECTDNAKSMRRTHDLCLKHHVPLMLLSAEGTDFAVMYYDFKNLDYVKKYGCLGCVGYTPLLGRAFPGILGPAAGMAGVFAAGEVIKLLGGLKSKLYGSMAYFRNGELAYFELASDDKCLVHNA